MLTIRIHTISHRRRVILHDVAFTASPGTFTTVIGRNGCGKSTLLSAIGGILPYAGSVTLDGNELSAMTPRERARKISLMLQMLRSPHVTVEELVAFGRHPWRNTGESMTEADREATQNAIRDAELTDLRHCYVDRISGGEQRRAHLGMQLAQDTPVMLLDESTAFMDADHEGHFLTLLRELCVRRNKTVVTVMHSMENALRFSDQAVLLDGGTVRFAGSPAQLLETSLIEDVFGLRRYCGTDETGSPRVFFASE
ncbi:MAG: ABC transporter ATP-binding protein [Clostridia bacterium]|nr:ABC transporter ATP-binding protein [Clostridia bacterium]